MYFGKSMYYGNHRFLFCFTIVFSSYEFTIYWYLLIVSMVSDVISKSILVFRTNFPASYRFVSASQLPPYYLGTVIMFNC